MTIKSKFNSLKKKTATWIENNPVDAGYILGFTLAAIGSLSGAYIGTKLNQKRLSDLWDENDAYTAEQYGPDAITFRSRDGRFGSLIPKDSE